MGLGWSVDEVENEGRHTGEENEEENCAQEGSGYCVTVVVGCADVCWFAVFAHPWQRSCGLFGSHGKLERAGISRKGGFVRREAAIPTSRRVT